MTQQNAALVEQAAATATATAVSLEEQAAKLKVAVAASKLSDTSGGNQQLALPDSVLRSA
ncbi:hypothetical protein PTKU15_85290 [Paraburkholderia terrae]|nr:hypothetical protein PTKU15_85290 [Paraburkholderia terrae]